MKKHSIGVFPDFHERKHMNRDLKLQKGKSSI